MSETLLTGRIVKCIAGFYYVRTEDGTVWQCRAKGLFRKEGFKPLAGDIASIEITHEGDREGNVVSVADRKNELVRPPVCNLDQVILTFAAAKPEPSHYLLNRFLVLLSKKELPAILVFNKRDLADDETLAQLREDYAACGAEVLCVSAKTGEGLEALSAHLNGKLSAIAGPSGVGKSSLINALLKETRMETGELSRKIERGKNTTRHSELFLLPDMQGYICDTPGFMSLDLKEIEPRDLHLYYPEFEERAALCRYAGCTHLTEPGCAVREALEKNDISVVRYDAYKLLFEELSGRRPVYEKKKKDVSAQGRKI